jgi:hypothetical protein
MKLVFASVLLLLGTVAQAHSESSMEVKCFGFDSYTRKLPLTVVLKPVGPSA